MTQSEIGSKQLFIMHYNRLVDVDSTDVDAADFPLVVIRFAETYENKHLQVRVLPFNSDNEEKEELTFMEKILFFRKTLRNMRDHPTKVEEIEQDTSSVATLVAKNDNVFTDEFQEFIDGWENQPITDYETHPSDFFIDNYLGLTQKQLDALTTGLGNLTA